MNGKGYMAGSSLNPRATPTSRRRVSAAAQGPQWRRLIRRELAWILALKFAALALLWLLFFSPAHRSHVDRDAASRQFALTGVADPRMEPLRQPNKEKPRD